METLIIEPLSKIIGIIFMYMLRISQNHGVALIFLSIVVNILLYPFYYLAERVEKKEKDIQLKMKPKLEEFKSIYKGYELHLYTSNVYRMNNYHPAYALRGLISLLIQIPFFMGAYAFLSNYSGFEGVSFLFISNLAQADQLIKIGSLSINLLPFVMTFINLYSGFIYTKDANKNEKITIVIIALLFLVILYASPASLLIYWTFNNVFSLVKNIITLKLEQKELIKEFA